MISFKLKSFLLLVIFLAGGLFSCTSPKSQLFAPAAIFGDHMVLQQQEAVVIWGKGTPNDEVKAQGSWSDDYVTTRTDENGNWQLELPTPKAGGPFLLDVAQSDTLIRFEDVMIGEVWLASGQSNMEMPLTGYLPTEPIDNYEQEIAEADWPGIRFITVKRAISPEPIKTFDGDWLVMSPETAAKSSASAYFFARELHEELRVPIGIIHASWGGTPVESWISKDKLFELEEFEKELASLEPEKLQVYEAWFDQFERKPFPSDDDGWKNLELADEHFHKGARIDSTWKSTEIPVEIETLDIPNPDGAVWFMKDLFIDQAYGTFTLTISEGIDDIDAFYVNGLPVGFTNCWNCPRAYKIEGAFRSGVNHLAFRIIDTGGGGGFRGDINFVSNDGEQFDIRSDWKYKQVAGVVSGKFLLFESNQEVMNNPPKGIEDYRLDSWTPSGLYNAMIHPVIPYNIQGAIWYQGESNVGRAKQYEKTFPGMISDWRSRWVDDFSFYYVQIAPFDYGNGRSGALREAQRRTLEFPRTGMASTMDIGHPTSIHPGNKQEVGRRLALWALAKDYGRDLVHTGPLYKNHYTEKGKVIVEFDHAESGLIYRPGDDGLFEIAGPNGVYVPAKAEEMDGKMAIWSDSIPNPKHVRYAWDDYVVVTLFNKEGLPASSFTTE